MREGAGSVCVILAAKEGSCLQKHLFPQLQRLVLGLLGRGVQVQHELVHLRRGGSEPGREREAREGEDRGSGSWPTCCLFCITSSTCRRNARSLPSNSPTRLSAARCSSVTSSHRRCRASRSASSRVRWASNSSARAARLRQASTSFPAADRSNFNCTMASRSLAICCFAAAQPSSAV